MGARGSPPREHPSGMVIVAAQVLIHRPDEDPARPVEQHQLVVLFDDRELQAGEKFTDSDLIGIPMRVVVSDKSLTLGGVEVKERAGTTPDVVSVDQCIHMFTKAC